MNGRKLPHGNYSIALGIIHYFMLNVPTLLRTIPLAPSKVMLKMMVNTWNCFKNALTNVTPVFIEIN
jgi:hypothetical protein